MLNDNQIFDLYGNMKAYEKYDTLLNEIIDYIFQIREHEKKEDYEKCKVKYDFIMNLIAFRSIEINRLTNINSDDLFNQFNNDYQELKKEIEKNEQ
jgi:hypothetical protein